VAGDQAARGGAVGGPLLGGDEVDRRHRGRLGCRVAEGALPGAVDVGDPALGSGHAHQLARLVEQLGERDAAERGERGRERRAGASAVRDGGAGDGGG
jgi:hypothetical protein